MENVGLKETGPKPFRRPQVMGKEEVEADMNASVKTAHSGQIITLPAQVPATNTPPP